MWYPALKMIGGKITLKKTSGSKVAYEITTRQSHSHPSQSKHRKQKAKKLVPYTQTKLPHNCNWTLKYSAIRGSSRLKSVLSLTNEMDFRNFKNNARERLMNTRRNVTNEPRYAGKPWETTNKVRQQRSVLTKAWRGRK